MCGTSLISVPHASRLRLARSCHCAIESDLDRLLIYLYPPLYYCDTWLVCGTSLSMGMISVPHASRHSGWQSCHCAIESDLDRLLIYLYPPLYYCDTWLVCGTSLSMGMISVPHASRHSGWQSCHCAIESDLDRLLIYLYPPLYYCDTWLVCGTSLSMGMISVPHASRHSGWQSCHCAIESDLDRLLIYLYPPLYYCDTWLVCGTSLSMGMISVPHASRHSGWQSCHCAIESDLDRLLIYLYPPLYYCDTWLVCGTSLSMGMISVPHASRHSGWQSCHCAIESDLDRLLIYLYPPLYYCDTWLVCGTSLSMGMISVPHASRHSGWQSCHCAIESDLDRLLIYLYPPLYYCDTWLVCGTSLSMGMISVPHASRAGNLATAPWSDLDRLLIYPHRYTTVTRGWCVGLVLAWE